MTNQTTIVVIRGLKVKETDTYLGEITLSKLFCLPYEKESTVGSKLFLFWVDSF